VEIINVEETINVEIDSVVLHDWISVHFSRSQETITQISKESIIFYDSFVTFQNE